MELLKFVSFIFFFFNATATTEIYTLSLHDALPISEAPPRDGRGKAPRLARSRRAFLGGADRKSTRLNSSHSSISYAVFCLKKKKTTLSIYFKYIIFVSLRSSFCMNYEVL